MNAKFDVAQANEIIQRIGSAIISDERYEGRNWASIAVVATIEPEALHISGYTFDEQGGYEAGTPRNRAIDALLADLQHATQLVGEAPWKSVLFQVKRDGMRVEVNYEYRDQFRWKVVPDRMEECIATLKPE